MSRHLVAMPYPGIASSAIRSLEDLAKHKLNLLAIDAAARRVDIRRSDQLAIERMQRIARSAIRRFVTENEIPHLAEAPVESDAFAVEIEAAKDSAAMADAFRGVCAISDHLQHITDPAGRSKLLAEREELCGRMAALDSRAKERTRTQEIARRNEIGNLERRMIAIDSRISELSELPADSPRAGLSKTEIAHLRQERQVVDAALNVMRKKDIA